MQMKASGPNRSKKNDNSVKEVAVLLVEDHDDTRIVLSDWLNRHDYKVTSAASCTEARAFIKTHKDFRLLISDVGLPDGSGYDLMVEFKKKFSANGIALTGLDREEDVAQSRASGFTTHLTKPVRIELLKIALAATLQVTTDDVFIQNGMVR
jgi:CheY-like chemotaxis protein